MLTEFEVQNSFRKLFAVDELADDSFEQAEALIDELQPENPLRHRLQVELEEIREIRG